MNNLDGYILLGRSFENHPLATRKPSTWSRIWIHILNHVEWKNGHRGRGEFSFAKSRKHLPPDVTNDAWCHALAWFREEKMITSKRTPHGLLITVLNYDKWQNAQSYRQSSTSDNSAPGTFSEDFLLFFRRHPKPTAINRSWEAWRTATKHVSRDVIMEGQDRLLDAIKRGLFQAKYTASTVNWLKDGHWADMYRGQRQMQAGDKYKKAKEDRAATLDELYRELLANPHDEARILAKAERYKDCNAAGQSLTQELAELWAFHKTTQKEKR